MKKGLVIEFISPALDSFLIKPVRSGYWEIFML